LSIANTPSNHRLLVWYGIITALFRCPSSPVDLTDDSPKICKPYFDASSYITPYVKPYYDDYASAYVESARPYVDNFQRHVYSPVVDLTKQSYRSYAAPNVDQARVYGQHQWKGFIKPYLEASRVLAKSRYDSALAPQIRTLSASIGPYYATAQQYGLQLYNERILPTYNASRPYAVFLYSSSCRMVTDIGLPYAKSAWVSTNLLFDRIVWPRLRILYGENVEPQLVRIGERLGRYRDGRKLKAVVDDIDR
jgi:hypothetical protein